MTDVRYLFICLFLLASTAVQGQEPVQEPVQKYRLELQLDHITTDVEVLAQPDSTLLLYTKKNNTWGTKADFAITKYNKKLNEVWQKEVDLKPQDYFMHSFSGDGMTYIVFGGQDNYKYKFLSINNTTGNLRVSEHKLEAIRSITAFHVLQGRYFLVGISKSDRNPLLLYLNPETDEAKPLPAIYGYESTVADIRINPDHQRVDVVLSESNNRISRLQVKSFDVEGNLISNHFILQQDDKSLLSAAVTPGDTATRMLIGVFGAGNLQLSQGFFTAPVISHQVADGEFYNFLSLRNSFKYMGPRREVRVRQREAQRIEAGKQPAYRHKLLLHDLITTPDGYVLTAEVYVTQRGSSSFTRPMGFRNFSNDLMSPLYSASPGSEVYKHTHALTLNFDKNGILLWDNLLVLKDIVTASPTKSIETTFTATGSVVAVYPEEDHIYYYVMDRDKYSGEQNKLELISLSDLGKHDTLIQLGIIPWYQGSFAAYGFKRNKGGLSENKSTFFINSVSF